MVVAVVIGGCRHGWVQVQFHSCSCQLQPLPQTYTENTLKTPKILPWTHPRWTRISSSWRLSSCFSRKTFCWKNPFLNSRIASIPRNCPCFTSISRIWILVQPIVNNYIGSTTFCSCDAYKTKVSLEYAIIGKLLAFLFTSNRVTMARFMRANTLPVACTLRLAHSTN